MKATIFSATLLIGTLSLPCLAQTVTIAPSSPYLSNCIPFGDPSYGPYTGFVYKNIPSFSLSVGDTLAFDLGRTNDTDIRYDIDMAATTTNGGDTTGAFTNVVGNAQTPLNPRGDAVVGNFELQYTIEHPFTFSGGGLAIRFSNPAGPFAADSTCDQVLVGADATDPSNYFVERFTQSADGTPRGGGHNGTAIGGFRVTASSVPEPGALALLGGGGALSLMMLGRKRSQLRRAA